jgi:hypothetical protein
MSMTMTIRKNNVTGTAVMPVKILPNFPTCLKLGVVWSGPATKWKIWISLKKNDADPQLLWLGEKKSH